MNIQTDDWHGEHLIRGLNRVERCTVDQREVQVSVKAARDRDAAILRPLVQRPAPMTRLEAAAFTGMTPNRVYEICKLYGFKYQTARGVGP